MIKKVLKFLDMFGFIILSLLCFLVATIVMTKANVDNSFLYDLSEYQLSVLVFIISGVIFLFLGLSIMIVEILKLSQQKEG